MIEIRSSIFSAQKKLCVSHGKRTGYGCPNGETGRRVRGFTKRATMRTSGGERLLVIITFM
jgi:hypothetical protein